MTEPIYLFYGASELLLKNEINELLEKFKINQINTIHYDLAEFSFLDVYEELYTVNFFSDKKAVILNNIFKLEETGRSSQEINKFFEYLKHPNKEDVILIISIPYDIDSNTDNKIIKELNLHAYKVKVAKPQKGALPAIINELFSDDGYDITDDAVDELIDRTAGDYVLILQEINKLKLHSYDTKKITNNAVKLLVSKSFDENIFDLTDAIIYKNKNKAIEIYYDLILNKEKPLFIFNAIANRMRILLYTKLLLKKGYTKNDLARHFGRSDAYANYLIRDSNQLTIEQLENYIDELNEIDYKIKSGKFDPKWAIEVFLIGV